MFRIMQSAVLLEKLETLSFMPPADHQHRIDQDRATHTFQLNFVQLPQKLAESIYQSDLIKIMMRKN